MTARWTAAAPLLAVLLISAAPVAAQDGSVPPESDEPTRRDLYLDMPYFMGGFEPDISMTRGEEHFADLDPNDEADVETRARLERLLDEVGADLEDLTSGYALVSQEDFFSFIIAIRIEGIAPGSLMPAYLPILYDDLVDPTGTEASIGGKDVLVISSVGAEDQYVPLYAYDEGDTLWLVQGPEDVVELTLENLPDAMQP